MTTQCLLRLLCQSAAPSVCASHIYMDKYILYIVFISLTRARHTTYYDITPIISAENFSIYTVLPLVPLYILQFGGNTYVYCIYTKLMHTSLIIYWRFLYLYTNDCCEFWLCQLRCVSPYFADDTNELYIVGI